MHVHAYGHCIAPPTSHAVILLNLHTCTCIWSLYGPTHLTCSHPAHYIIAYGPTQLTCTQSVHICSNYCSHRIITRGRFNHMYMLRNISSVSATLSFHARVTLRLAEYTRWSSYQHSITRAQPARQPCSDEVIIPTPTATWTRLKRGMIHIPPTMAYTCM